ncbi:aspartate aminotransferase family protein [Azospirillum cavernae]|uniref:Aspartate aminotransferase family protein n=1 Tax=Azospirillum cavernae TaxID=2320860 RepID=A0A418VPZ4_9PROT|nr:aspartate aminotransferase family protein [Azospirillum cavernae]RJF78279.1 aspartate aminotransferase family protein [Azospirillum cavernae]
MTSPNRLSFARPDDGALDALWMPFTANRHFKASPRLLATAEGMSYTTPEGHRILDGTAGLWCVNAGHGRREIADAIHRQACALDYASTFQVGHSGAFSLARRLAALLPGDLDRVFFTNSGSEAVDTALKIAIAYHQRRGEGQRTRLIGRERGYHGVGFGGVTVGGVVANRRDFGPLLPGADHLPHTYDRNRQAFSRGQPDWGGHRAEALERLVALHGASTIAAVIVEPVATSAGVLAPPVGYLERLRGICDAHGILLIFDEVVSGFGRMGAPFAAERFNVLPDMVVCAKGLTNGVVPMGAVAVRRPIHDHFMQGPDTAVELFHGYTYSGHPVAAAAGHATLDIYEREGLLSRVSLIADQWADAVHALRGSPHVADIRSIGLVAGIDIEPAAGRAAPGAFDVFTRCFERGLLVRAAGDCITLSPPLIVQSAEIAQITGILAEVLASF